MAALPSLFAEVTTLQSTTDTTYGDVTGATLTGFTAGNKYLIFVGAQVSSSGSTALTSLQVIHGSTAFADSEATIRPNGSGLYIVNSWLHVWEAVTSEDVKLQFKTSANAGRVDQVVMLAIDLDSLTENTDWFFAERSNDDALTTSGPDGASVTFTPATEQDYVVLTYSQVALQSATISSGTLLSSSIDSVPDAWAEAADTSEVWGMVLMRNLTLPASSQTLMERGISQGGDAGTRLHSKVFAIRRSLFAQSVAEYTEAATNLSATNYASNLETASITPAVQGNVVVLAFTVFDKQNAGREFEVRLQVDDADQPDTQTADNYQFYQGRDARDRYPVFLFTREELSAAAHTIDLDASSDSTTATPVCTHTSIVAFTLELAAAGGAISGSSTLSIAPSGTLTGSGALLGLATISLAPSAAMAGAGALAGSSALSIAPGGTMEALLELAASATLDLAASGTAEGAGALLGSGMLALTPTGTMSGAGDIVGSATLTLIPAAEMLGAGALAGSGVVEINATGALDQPEGVIFGSATLTLTPGGTMLATAGLAGSATVALTPTGSLLAFGDLSGFASLSLTPQGVLLADGALAGSSVLELIASGALTGGAGELQLVGSALIEVGASGSLIASGELAGSALLDLVGRGTMRVILPRARNVGVVTLGGRPPQLSRGRRAP